jgi:hypothetical protein
MLEAIAVASLEVGFATEGMTDSVQPTKAHAKVNEHSSVKRHQQSCTRLLMKHPV